MNPSQLRWLLDYKVPAARLITAEDLDDKSPRTLLYGYTLDRLTWHVYISQKGEIETVIYGVDTSPVKVPVTKNEHYVPNKRLYPARCDFYFCKKLAESGVYLPFTTFSEAPGLKGIYYGLTCDDGPMEEV